MATFALLRFRIFSKRPVEYVDIIPTDVTEVISFVHLSSLHNSKNECVVQQWYVPGLLQRGSELLFQ
jgi:hypothetical protein